MALASRVKTHRHVCVSNQIPQLLTGGIDQWGVDCNNSFSWFELQILELRKIREINSPLLGWERQC
jgi:hypothetical protein